MVENETKANDWHWMAVESRNASFDGLFYFAVRTTGVFCRPSCASRAPKRANVTFFATATDARLAGYRPCLRCKPADVEFAGEAQALVSRAFKQLRSEEIASVEQLSEMLGVTSGHLQKTFRSVLGLSPKEVIDMMRIENFKEAVRETDVTTSLYESGFGSSRGLYEKAGERLGMTPAKYKKGGKGERIAYTVVSTPLGSMLIAATERGICSASFGDSEADLARELGEEFFAAQISRDDKRLKQAAEAIVRGLRGERAILNLPLDIRGTAFQMRVWSELRKIPYGETRSYAEVAEAVGNRRAVRAVARACATNPVAVVTPCHRVVGSDGRLSGYRWGIERKKQLLDGEGTERS